MELKANDDGTFDLTGLTEREVSCIEALTGQVVASSECQIFDDLMNGAEDLPDYFVGRFGVLDWRGNPTGPLNFREFYH